MNPEGDHEAALAGICLAPDNAAALDDIAVAGITAEDFTTPAGHVVVAALNLREAGRPVDLYSLPGHLSAETLAALGGPVGLNRLVDGAPPTAHAAFHCANLIEVGTKRRLSTLARGWLQRASTLSSPNSAFTMSTDVAGCPMVKPS